MENMAAWRRHASTISATEELSGDEEDPFDENIPMAGEYREQGKEEAGDADSEFS